MKCKTLKLAIEELFTMYRMVSALQHEAELGTGKADS